MHRFMSYFAVEKILYYVQFDFGGRYYQNVSMRPKFTNAKRGTAKRERCKRVKNVCEYKQIYF